MNNNRNNTTYEPSVRTLYFLIDYLIVTVSLIRAIKTPCDFCILLIINLEVNILDIFSIIIRSLKFEYKLVSLI